MRLNTAWMSKRGRRPLLRSFLTAPCRNRRFRIDAVITGALLVGGCAVCPNQYADDGPSTDMPAHSPAGDDLYARYQPAPQRVRESEPTLHAAHSGAVTHLPLWFEDPFVEKGSGRDDHRLDWEDWFTMAYGAGRAMVNLALSPGTVVITPPWMFMESDGRAALRWPDIDEFDARPVHRWPGFEAFAAQSKRTEPAEPQP